MNKKSILYIFVVLMALSLTLGAVSAEEAVAADAVADVADVAAVEPAADVIAVEEAPAAEESVKEESAEN